MFRAADVAGTGVLGFIAEWLPHAVASAAEDRTKILVA